jgi:5'-nucleotidase
LDQQKDAWKMKTKPIALVDMDGTLCDFDAAMSAELEALRGPNEDPTLDETAYEDVPHIKARRRLIKAKPGFWRTLPKLELGFQILETLQSIGYQPHVLTKGPAKSALAYAEKVEWCRANIPGIPITLSDDKGLVYGRVLVDDWVPYVTRWLEHRPRGMVVAVAHRWNLDIEKAFPQVVRYDGSNYRQMRSALEAQYKAYDWKDED